MISAADLQVRISSDTKDAERGIKRVDDGIKGFIKRAAYVGTGVLGAMAFRGMARGFMSGAAGALDFGAQMANVNSIAQLTDEALAKVTDGVMAIASNPAITQAPAVLAAGLYDIYSSGFQGADALNVLEKSAIAATAGITDTATSARAITAVLNAFSLGAGDAGHVSDVLFQTVNDGVITFEQLANNLGNVIPIANSLGLGIEDVGAAYAQMTLKGVNASAAETQIASLMRSALNPTQALTDAVQAHGYESAEAAIKTKGLAGFLDILNDASGGSATALMDLLGTQEAMNAATILGADGVKGYVKELDKMKHASDGAGATNKALEKQMNSASFAIAKMRQTVQQLAVIGFGILAPAITKVAQTMTNFLSKGVIPFTKIIGAAAKGGFAFNKMLKELPQPLRRSAHAVGVITEALGDMWRHGFSKNEMRQAFHGLQALGQELDQGVHVVLTFVVDAVLDTASWLYQHKGDIWGGIKSLAGWTTDHFRQAITATINGAIELGGDLASAAGDLWGWIRGKLFGGAAATPTSGAGRGVPSAFTGGQAAGDGIDLGDVVIRAGAVLGGDIATIAGDVWGWLKGKIMGTGGGASQDPASPMYGGAGTIGLGTVVLEVTGVVAHAAQSVIDAASAGIKSALGNIQVEPNWTLIVGVPSSYGWAGGWDNANTRATAIEGKLSEAGDAVVKMGWKVLLLTPIITDPVFAAGVVAVLIQEQIFTRVPVLSYPFKLLAAFVLTGVALALDAANAAAQAAVDLYKWTLDSVHIPVNLIVDLTIDVAQHVKSGAQGIWDWLTDPTKSGLGTVLGIHTGGHPGGLGIAAPEDLNVGSSISVTANLDMATWNQNINQIKNDTDTYNNKWFYAFFGIDTSDAVKKYTDASGWGDVWDKAMFTSTFDINNGPAAIRYSDASGWGDAWGKASFSSIFDIDNGPAAAAYSDAFSWGDTWAASSFTATLYLDTSAALNSAYAAAQEIDNLLPHSPAKRGPLSRVPDFGYVGDAMLAMSHGLESKMPNPYGRGAMLRAGRPRVGHTVNVFALKSDEYVRLLRHAEAGHDIAQFGRELGASYGV